MDSKDTGPISSPIHKSCHVSSTIRNQETLGCQGFHEKRSNFLPTCLREDDKFKNICLVLLGFLLCACSSHKRTDVSKEAGYNEMMGRVYQTNSDVVVLQFSRNDNEMQIKAPGTTEVPKFKDLQGRKFPYDYQGSPILGVLRAGATFKVTRVIRVESTESAYIDYKAIITSTGAFQEFEINPTWLAQVTYYPNVPRFKSEYVEEIVQTKK